MPGIKEKELEPNLFSNLGISLNSHIYGSYTHIDDLRQKLEYIQGYLQSPDSKKNIVQSIIEKLQEGADSCTPGFHDRVNNILLMLTRPSTLQEFLRAIRTNLVDLVAHQRTDEVHHHTTFFNHAHFAGFGVNPLNLSDAHAEQQLSKEEDIEALATAINERYTGWSVLNDLMLDIEGELRTFYDYAGCKSEESQGYTYGIYHSILDFFKTLLGDKNLGYGELFHYDDEMAKVIDINWHAIQIKLWEKLNQDEYLFLTTEEERFYNKLLSQNEENFEEEAKLIQSLELYRYPSLLKHVIKSNQQKIISLIFDSVELEEPLSFFKALAHYPHFEEDIDKRALFYQTKILAWMAIADNQTKLAQSQDARLLASALHTIAVLDTKTQQQILAPIINASNIRMLAAHGQLQAFQLALNLIEKGNSQAIQRILTEKDKDGRNLLMWAAQFQPQAFQLLLSLIAKLDSEAQTQILTDKNKEGQNILIYIAFQARLSRYKSLLNLIIKLDSKVQKQILADKNKDGYDILTLAAKFQPQVFLSLLNLIEQWDRQSQTKTLTDKNKDGYNLLMLTALFQPQSFQFLLNLIEKWNNQAQKQVLINKTNYGDSVLIYAQAHPQSFQSLLNKIAKLDEMTQKQILTNTIIDFDFETFSSSQPKTIKAVLDLLEQLNPAQKQTLADKNKLACNLLILTAQNHPQLFDSLFTLITHCGDKRKKQILADQHIIGRHFIRTIAQSQPTVLESLLEKYFLYFALQDTYTKKQILVGDYPFHNLSGQIRKQLTNKINALWKESDNEIFQEIKKHYKDTNNNVHNALKKAMIMEAISKLPQQDRATFKQEISKQGSLLYRALNFKRQWFLTYSCFFKNTKAKTLSKCQLGAFRERPEPLRKMASSG